MTEKAERGGIVSIAPFGYKVTDGRLVVDAEKARIVSKIFADFLNNKDINMICDNLNSAKLKLPKAIIGIAVPLNTFCKIPFISAKSGGIQSAKQAEISITKI